MRVSYGCALLYVPRAADAPIGACQTDHRQGWTRRFFGSLSGPRGGDWNPARLERRPTLRFVETAAVAACPGASPPVVRERTDPSGYPHGHVIERDLLRKAEKLRVDTGALTNERHEFSSDERGSGRRGRRGTRRGGE